MIEHEPERYEWDESGQYNFALDRRDFFVAAGAGLLFSAAIAEAQSNAPLSARIHFGADGRITVLTGKVEVGQGSRAQLTQAAAEELRVPADRITLIMADTAVTPNDGTTAGSRTTPSTVPTVRRAAAAAREALIKLAGERWGVDRASLKVEDGVIAASGGRKIAYADLAKTDIPIAPDVALTRVDEWKVLGQPVGRPNARPMVVGEHRFPSDIVRPNMLYGKVLRPPSYRASLEAVDLATARAIPGVVPVRDGNFVGCAAPNTHAARKAIAALEKTASWKAESQISSKELFAHLRKTGTNNRRAPRVQSRGDAAQSLASAAKVIRASYEVAYIQHAPMEPRAAVAEWVDGKVTVWTGTQRPDGVQKELAEAFHIPADRVRVVVPDTGGGFGGKHTGETAVEAARLAKAAGRPVSLQWTREEEFTWAYFRPAALIEAAAGLDASGRITAWDYANYNSGASALQTPYRIANAREQFVYCDSPLREGSYRALASTANNFARECLMDEAAVAAGQDPLDFRLAHLEPGRLRTVLEAAAERFEWRKRRKSQPARRGVGLACGTEKGSFVAACAEVAIEDGTLRILNLTQAFDCGAIMNPVNLRSQVEGCMIMTLGAVLREEIEFENGRILNPKFSRYRVPRFKDVPPIDTVLLNRPDQSWAGAGETPMIALAPAIANAVLHATGKTVRSLPIRLTA
jgi:isoquinoline 1-oxidoreductase